MGAALEKHYAKQMEGRVKRLVEEPGLYG